jgi:PGF-pre-PGF domain-containing protein
MVGKLGRALVLATLLGSLLLSFSVSQVKAEGAGAAGHIIAPTADSWVELKNPTTNKGSDQKLHVRVEWDSGKGIVTNLRRSYLKFDLSGLPPLARIDRAILHLYRTTSEDSIPSVYSTTDNWIESGINWNTQPSPGAVENDSGTASGSWVEWDITSYAASEFDGDKVLGVVLRFNPESGSDQHADFISREGKLNQRPWLEISYSTPTTIPITITSSQTGSGFVNVDNVVITTPQTFNWMVGSTHTLEALPPVAGPTGTQYVWTSWSDGGDQTHVYTVPGASETVTANWKTQYKLTMVTNFGTTSPSAGVYWENAGAVLTISATAPSVVAGENYVWNGWTGTGTGSYTGTSNPANNAVTMNSPITETTSWKTQYLVSFNQTGSAVAPTVDYTADTDPTGTVPFSVWVKLDTEISYTYQAIVPGNPGVHYVLIRVSPESPQTINDNDNFTITGTYKTQNENELLGWDNQRIDFAGAWTHVIIYFDNVYVENIAFDMKENIQNVQIIVQQLVGQPSGISIGPADNPYGYFEVIVINLDENKIENIVLTFKVEKSWISANSIDESTITLNWWNNTNNTWTSYHATKIGEDDNYSYFSVNLPHLSTFAAVIGGSGITATTYVAPPAPSPPSYPSTPPPTTPPPTFTAAFVLQSLIINPTQASVGEAVGISVSVMNTGSGEGTYLAELRINGALIDIKTVTLKAGLNDVVTFYFTPESDGTYSVEIGGLTGSFSVVTPPAVVPLSASIVLIAILVVGWLLGGIALFRKSSNHLTYVDG